jgi:hypothetical protein
LWCCFAVLDGLLEQDTSFTPRQATGNARDDAEDLLFWLFPPVG